MQRCLSNQKLQHLIELEKSLRVELETVLHQEELLWFQKSRMDAIRDGDRNTKFFHLSTVIRRKRNKIGMLKNADGSWITKPLVVKQLVVQYLECLFTEEEPNALISNFLPGCFPTIPAEDWAILARPYA